MNKSETTITKNGRELSITRLFDAPADLVWRAWTGPDLIKQCLKQKPVKPSLK
ncbi:hypothetical protein QQ020_20710 [Fulvivirgaceae bacterium BMA12]|uniref:Uncharacterized protein n=1 Tax=Agaribacillus aureus TaxID=3051825 RepID=A0ABT8L9T7_9BACT|nr:hypothetical protein [Fulvivirgaceae bacterium BMA12]